MKKKTKTIKRKADLVINGVKLYEHDPREFFLNHENMSIALTECIVEGDWEAFQDIFSTYLSIINKEELSRKSKVPIATIRRMAAGSNFNISNYFKVMKVLNKKKAA